METKLNIIGARPYEEVRDLCHEIKTMGPYDMVKGIAWTLLDSLPQKAVLIPIPGHTGFATHTLRLAYAIEVAASQSETKKEIHVVHNLIGERHVSLCETKHNGGKAEDINVVIQPITLLSKIILSTYIKEGYVPVLVDNVVDTGKTARAAIAALGNIECQVLAIGKTGNDQ